MTRSTPLLIVLVLSSGGPASAAPETVRDEERVAARTQLARDYRELASRGRLIRLGIGLGAAGALANTDADQSLFDEYGEIASTEDLEDLSTTAKALGTEAAAGAILLSALALGLGEGEGDAPLGRWWRRNARAYVVGAPSLYYLQQLTGGSRPGEPEGSSWKPFEGNHGISGHAFFGAVPLLTAARSTDRRWLRVLGITASLLPAWSRVHDGDHYPSQALLGWLLAWEATGAVAGSKPERPVEVVPIQATGGVGLALRWHPPW